AMKTRLVLKAGQRGTRHLQAVYGEQLLYVRYRYDAERRRRVKTVELIVEEADWAPPDNPAGQTAVDVVVAPGEHELIEQIRAAGGDRLADQGVWKLRYDQAIQLGLAGRIVGTLQG
ncbi:MAG TPA: hypothetical protein VFT99_08300, partial [Roseiflexaceae bacterium]|nr:hypothetical protein [Roseiflexaceae bacterium]